MPRRVHRKSFQNATELGDARIEPSDCHDLPSFPAPEHQQENGRPRSGREPAPNPRTPAHGTARHGTFPGSTPPGGGST